MSLLEAKTYKLKPIPGFTLIELLVVIAIISLLSSIALASLSQARGKAKVTRASVEMREIVKAATRYYLDTDVPPPRDNYNTCGEAIFVTGNYQVKVWDESTNDWASTPTPIIGWRGPYLTSWTNTPWGSKYGWSYWGDEDDSFCANFSGNDARYVISISPIPYTDQNIKELMMLHDLLDDDVPANLRGIDPFNPPSSSNYGNGNGSGIADMSMYDGILSFFYRPFRGEEPSYERGQYYEWLPKQLPNSCTINGGDRTPLAYDCY